MPGTFPSLSFTSASATSFKYPVQRKLTKPSSVATFCDFSEQRWNKSTAKNLIEFEFNYSKLSTADKEILRAFYAQQNGEFATDWTLVFDNVWYANCQFMGPFQAKNVGPQQWDVTLRVRSLQAGSAGLPVSQSGGVPTGSNGPVTGVTFYAVTAFLNGGGFADMKVGGDRAFTGDPYPGAQLFQNEPYSQRTDSWVLTPAPDPYYGTFVTFMIWTTLAGLPNPPSELRVYDAYLNVTYSDGTSKTVHPSGYSIVPGPLGTQSTITNAASILDGDSSTYVSLMYPGTTGTHGQLKITF